MRTYEVEFFVTSNEPADPGRIVKAFISAENIGEAERKLLNAYPDNNIVIRSVKMINSAVVIE